VEDVTDQIGERLRKARGKAELEVDDVVFQTRLPKAVIEALEADDFSHFTSPVYAKSFLAQYSAFLGVDAAPWLDALRPSSFIEGDPRLPLLEPFRGPQPEIHSRQQSGGSWMSAVWLMVLTGGLVFAAIKAFQFFESRFGVEVMLVPNEANESAKDPLTKPAVQVEALPAPAASDPAVPIAEDEPVQSAPRAIIVR
jgi:cytoskeletal protein RodZ